MERASLERLSDSDLKYYTKQNGIETPLNVSHEQLVDLILGRQARVLTENARKALEQVNRSSQGTTTLEDVLNVDVRHLEPQTSVYSSAGPGGTIYSETVIVGRRTTVMTDGSHEQAGSAAHSEGPLHHSHGSPSGKYHDIQIRKKARKVSGSLTVVNSISSCQLMTII